MDRNTIIAFILIGGILVLWLFLNSPEPTKQTGKGNDTTIVIQDTTALKKKEKETPPPEKIKQEEKQQEEIKDLGEFTNLVTEEGNIVTVETDKAIYELSTKGANFHKVFLKEFKNWYSSGKNGNGFYYDHSVQLINYGAGDSYDISFVTTDGKAINTKEFNFQTSARNNNKITGKDSLVIRFTIEPSEGQQIVKTFKFYGNKYLIDNTIEFEGMQNLVSNSTYDVVWENGIRFVEKNTVNEANYSNTSIFYGDEKVTIDAPSGGESEEKDFNGRVDWVAVRNKYFAVIMIPGDPSGMEGAYVEGHRIAMKNQGIQEIYNTRLTAMLNSTAKDVKTYRLYMGPVEYERLKEVGYKLDNLVDFGSFFGLKFVVRPIAEYILLPLFNFIHRFIPNYGFVIIVFSLIIKIVVYPLTKSSYQSMKKMQLLQPKIQEIKEKHKEDQQKMNKETMKLYQTYGINPAGGCLPLVLQMPIFVALWGLFQSAIELRQQPFILWIKDLSQPDVVYDLGFKLPLFGIQYVSGLALLMGITTFAQQKMSVKDPKQKALVYFMPVMLTVLFMSFPSGLNLYYFMFNVLSIAQQYYINHKQGSVELVPVDPSKKKKGFMSRMMEAAEQQAKQQQKKKR